jgi:hypothetical protein
MDKWNKMLSHVKYILLIQKKKHCPQWAIKPLMPELNPSMQCCLTRFFSGDFAA